MKLMFSQNAMESTFCLIQILILISPDKFSSEICWKESTNVDSVGMGNNYEMILWFCHKNPGNNSGESVLTSSLLLLQL